MSGFVIDASNFDQEGRALQQRVAALLKPEVGRMMEEGAKDVIESIAISLKRIADEMAGTETMNWLGGNIERIADVLEAVLSDTDAGGKFVPAHIRTADIFRG